MTGCSAFSVDIADTLAGSAAPAARARAEAHLAECAACRANAALWDALGDMPVELPSPALQAGFEAQLKPKPSAPRWAWIAIAAALAVGVFSFLAGRYTAPKTDTDIASLRHEVRNLREVVALSLLDQQSASERLRGIRYSAAIDSADPEIVDALSRTLGFTPVAEGIETPEQAATLRALVDGGAVQTGGPEMASAPPILRAPLLSRYLDGLVFCATIHGRGGFRALDGAHRDPPTTSEQVLHPERYLAHEDGEPVALPELASLAAAGAGSHARVTAVAFESIHPYDCFASWEGAL